MPTMDELNKVTMEAWRITSTDTVSSGPSLGWGVVLPDAVYQRTDDDAWLNAMIAEHDAMRVPDVLFPDNDTPHAPSAPIDTVIGDLAAGRVVQKDRFRLGEALDKANADASGPKVKGFDHIVGRVRGGMATLTGRE